MLFLFGLLSLAAAQIPADAPSCADLCATVKVQEGYCNATAPVLAFTQAYQTCVQQNCLNSTDLTAAQTLNQTVVCNVASAILANVSSSSAASVASAASASASGSQSVNITSSASATSSGVGVTPAVVGGSAVAPSQPIATSAPVSANLSSISALSTVASSAAPGAVIGSSGVSVSSAPSSSASANATSSSASVNATSSVAPGAVVGASGVSTALGSSATAAPSSSANATSSSVSLSSSASSSASSATASGYASGLQSALQSAGLSTFAGYVPQLLGEQGAFSLAAGNRTVFAPSDSAFQGATNVTLDTLRYHIVNASIDPDSLPYAPQNTILRTLLNTSPVALPGNVSQVLKVSKRVDLNNTLAIGNAAVPVTQSFSYQNLQIEVIGSILSVPGNLTAQLSSRSNYSSFLAALQQANLVSTLQNVVGLTVFAPTNDAFAQAQSQLGQYNSTALSNVLLNHVLNATVAYSPILAQTKSLTSAAGEPLSVQDRNNAIYIASGLNSAHVVAADILLSNGVLHGVDSVVLNDQADPTAAAAAASATSTAATRLRWARFSN